MSWNNKLIRTTGLVLVSLLVGSTLGIGLKIKISKSKATATNVSNIVLSRNQAIKKARESGQKNYDFKIKGPLPIGGF